MAEQQNGDKVVGPRVIYLGGTIDDASTEKVIGGLMGLNIADNKAPIHFILNSGGGQIHHMFGIYDIMKACKAPVWTLATGKAMSASVLLLAAGCKGERRISQRATIMAHEFSTVAGGPLSFMRDHVDELERLQTQYIKALIEETKLTKTKIKKLMAPDKETYLNAYEAVDLGFADRIIK